MDTSDDLLAVFDPDPDRAADKIEALFVRLVSFFRWRRCAVPEDLAQETLRRGFGRIRGGVTITTPDPARFFFGIAQNVLKEHRHQRADDAAVSIGDLLPLLQTVDFRETESRICLDQCLGLLPLEERRMLSRYLSEDCAELARELRMPAATLRVKALRARRKLEKWVRQSTSPVERVK